MRKTLFISDLHLDANHPDMVNSFLQLLDHASTGVDAIYILGDLFEAWIGDEEETYLQPILQALRALTAQSIPIYFLHGNRDFLVGKKFAHLTGCQLLPTEYKVSIYATPVLLLHGDTLCTLDLAYQRARKIMRTRWLQILFLSLPLAWRKKFAAKMRSASSEYTQQHSLALMDVTQSAVEDTMRKYDVTCMVHGHTHRPATHEFELDGKHAQRIVLGAWHERGNVLIWSADGEKSWVQL